MSQLKYYHSTKQLKKPTIELPRSKLSFKSKALLKAYLVKTINNLLDVVINESAEEYPFFCDMIDRHYEINYEEKMEFVVHTEKGYDLKRSKDRTPYRRSEPYRCYVFIPSQNKWKSFSLFNKCVSGTNFSEKVLKAKEYRQAIEPQIIIQRKMRKWKCEVCGSQKLLDIDHYPKTFNQIVIEYEAGGTEETNPQSFAEYHLKVAKYRLLCHECHVIHGKKK